MTPKTAAALRALVTKWREESECCEAQFSDSGIGWGGVTHARHADELAAVLTQEGEEPVVQNIMHRVGEIYDESHPAEPRAATDEPLFTASMYGTADAALKARDEWRAEQSEPRAAKGAETVRMMKDSNGDIHEECPDCRGECTPVECDTKPTAAAAVPAGGDAVGAKKCSKL